MFPCEVVDREIKISVIHCHEIVRDRSRVPVPGIPQMNALREISLAAMGISGPLDASRIAKDRIQNAPF